MISNINTTSGVTYDLPSTFSQYTPGYSWVDNISVTASNSSGTSVRFTFPSSYSNIDAGDYIETYGWGSGTVNNNGIYQIDTIVQASPLIIDCTKVMDDDGSIPVSDNPADGTDSSTYWMRDLEMHPAFGERSGSITTEAKINDASYTGASGGLENIFMLHWGVKKDWDGDVLNGVTQNPGAQGDMNPTCEARCRINNDSGNEFVDSSFGTYDLNVWQGYQFYQNEDTEPTGELTYPIYTQLNKGSVGTTTPITYSRIIPLTSWATGNTGTENYLSLTEDPWFARAVWGPPSFEANSLSHNNFTQAETQSALTTVAIENASGTEADLTDSGSGLSIYETGTVVLLSGFSNSNNNETAVVSSSTASSVHLKKLAGGSSFVNETAGASVSIKWDYRNDGTVWGTWSRTDGIVTEHHLPCRWKRIFLLERSPGSSTWYVKRLKSGNTFPTIDYQSDPSDTLGNWYVTTQYEFNAGWYYRLLIRGWSVRGTLSQGVGSTDNDTFQQDMETGAYSSEFTGVSDTELSKSQDILYDNNYAQGNAGALNIKFINDSQQTKTLYVRGYWASSEFQYLPPDKSELTYG